MSCGAGRKVRAGSRASRTRDVAFGDPRARWWLTTTGSNPRDSATENTQPTALRRSSQRRRDRAMVKRCGKSAPRRWRHRRQGKPHRLQDQAAGRRRRTPRASRPKVPSRTRPGYVRLAPHDRRVGRIPHSRDEQSSRGGRASRQRLVQINDRRPPFGGNRTRLTDRPWD